MSEGSEDPVVSTARRESLLILWIFLCALVYTVTFCYVRGYGRSPESLTFIFGFPDWVFWGIVLPWGVCVGLSFWFGNIFMRDADLGVEGNREEEDV